MRVPMMMRTLTWYTFATSTTLELFFTSLWQRMLAGTSRKYLLYLANRCLNISFSTRCSTKPDPNRPYVAKFPDKFGNLCCRKIPRPAVISTYFENSYDIDSLNHMRQHELGLEKKWIVKAAECAPWFHHHWNVSCRYHERCFLYGWVKSSS
jgi:hypothetical protein